MEPECLLSDLLHALAILRPRTLSTKAVQEGHRMMALMLVAAALNGAFLFALVACVGTLTLTALGVTQRPHYPAEELTIAVGLGKAALCWMGTRILATRD
jgi:hypothetical protein